jgi:hypothetical protein
VERREGVSAETYYKLLNSVNIVYVFLFFLFVFGENMIVIGYIIIFFLFELYYIKIPFALLPLSCGKRIDGYSYTLPVHYNTSYCLPGLPAPHCNILHGSIIYFRSDGSTHGVYYGFRIVFTVLARR